MNQDINGIGKNYDPNATWSSLGVLGDPTNALAAVPEPNFGWGIAGLAVAVVASRRFAKR